MRLLPGVIHPPLARQACGQAGLSPVLSCTAWGLSCLLPRGRSGGLLPHRFTLTHPHSGSDNGRFVFCDTVRDAGLLRRPRACARHAALRCPDFPPVRAPPKQNRRAIPPADPFSLYTRTDPSPREISMATSRKPVPIPGVPSPAHDRRLRFLRPLRVDLRLA
jgi:hypothetical protein